MALKEYKPEIAFTGVIGRTFGVSKPAWPEPQRAKEGAPNVLFIVQHDTGFGQLSPFGGLVETPVLDRLARNGLRYTNMHATEVCLPTEAYFERLSSFRVLIW